MYAKKKKRWIQKALGSSKKARAKKRGALHRQLGIPEREIIPVSLLVFASREPGLLGQRARLALTLRKIGRKRRYERS